MDDRYRYYSYQSAAFSRVGQGKKQYEPPVPSPPIMQTASAFPSPSYRYYY